MVPHLEEPQPLGALPRRPRQEAAGGGELNRAALVLAGGAAVGGLAGLVACAAALTWVELRLARARSAPAPARR